MDTHRPLDLRAIAERRDFRELCAKRKRLGNSLAIAMAVIYFTFIGLVAFAPAVLATPIASGSAISVGIITGVGIMISGFVLTAIYVAYASAHLDAMVDALKEFAL
ncbi:DUF485 domain-containing protein [Mesorhizobium sp. B2-4-17]|uniref:DUF485 domain-containing protein n=1 Tax=Mesorhizobium sp. B2-4-17 TaxID=2589932 RepID=UPI00112C8C68|nr:DUF485 domain-containing protein [Mesorhizobium sp. B2-4-17]TPK75274.1 DUF485 domain-containing protein [Mesorhizobium sp. B2-4-17]